MAGEVSAFISYSHDDMEFVDRLEADLRARGFVTWVDRRRLEGTYEWQPQIDRAIEQFGMVIVVVSPRSLTSEYVQHEYQYAHQLDKRIVPVLCKPISVPLPSEFGRTQYVDFVVNPYAAALKELINGWQDPTFEQHVDSRTLYNQAHDLEPDDAERAAILYQRLLDREPQYAGGRVRLELERLNQQLYPQRAQRLREQAVAAREAGQYGEEAGALEALIALGDHDHATFSWAEEYLVVARQNSKWLDAYENVKHFVTSRDTDSARDLLGDLWRMENAPFFRDPAAIAPRLNLKVPMTYEEWKERRLADEAKAKKEKNAAAERDTLDMQAESNAAKVASEETVKWQVACNIAQSHPSQDGTHSLAQLHGWGAAADAAANSLAVYWTKWLANERQASRRKRNQVIWMACISVSSLGIGVLACTYIPVVSNPESGDGGLGTLLWLIVATGEVVALGVCLPLIAVLYRQNSNTRNFENQIDNQAQSWISLSKAEHEYRFYIIDEKKTASSKRSPNTISATLGRDSRRACAHTGGHRGAVSQLRHRSLSYTS